MKIVNIQGDRYKYIELLKMADPSENSIDSYILQGKLLAMYRKGICIGVLHYREIQSDSVEISNISIIKSSRRRGYGKQLLAYAIENIKLEGYRKIFIGTGNSSINNIAFYQKMGFEICDIWKNYFINYKEKIYENGIRCKHMLRFEYIIY